MQDSTSEFLLIKTIKNIDKCLTNQIIVIINTIKNQQDLQMRMLDILENMPGTDKSKELSDKIRARILKIHKQLSELKDNCN